VLDPLRELEGEKDRLSSCRDLDPRRKKENRNEKGGKRRKVNLVIIVLPVRKRMVEPLLRPGEERKGRMPYLRQPPHERRRGREGRGRRGF